MKQNEKKFKLKNSRGLESVSFSERVEGDLTFLDFENAPVKQMRFSKVKPKNNETAIGFEVVGDLTHTALPPVQASFQVFAIDPTQIEFESASFTIGAIGETLWKCKDWNFQAQSCFGEWVKLFDFQAGETYEIELGPSDPGYAVSNSTKGLIGYYESGVTTPRYKTWGGAATGWSAEGSAGSLGTGADIIWSRVVCSPLNWSHAAQGATMQNCILATIDDQNMTKVQVWNGSAWDSVATLTNLTNGVYGGHDLSNYRPFDITFEQKTGRGIAVFTMENTTFKGRPFYSIWYPENRSWSAPAAVTNKRCTDGNGTPLFIELSANPTNNHPNEIMMAYRDSTYDYCAHVWNGTAWPCQSSTSGYCGNMTALNTSWADNDNLSKKFMVAYEQTSGEGLAVFESTLDAAPSEAAYSYVSWGKDSAGNQGWVNYTEFAAISNWSGYVMWVMADERKNSNHLAIAGILKNYTSTADGDNAGIIFWNGTGMVAGILWYGALFKDNSTAVPVPYTTQEGDVAYVDSSTGETMLAWADGIHTNYNPLHVLCQNENSCFNYDWTYNLVWTTSNQQCGTATSGNHSKIVTLHSDPNGKDVLMLFSTNSTSEPICSVLYNGTSETWGGLSTIEDSNSVLKTAIPFDFDFYRASSNTSAYFSSMPPWYNSTSDKCSGTADACATFNTSWCGNESGCIASIDRCSGLASPCSTWTGNEAVCRTQKACIWSAPNCVGVHSPCIITNYPDQASCNGNLTCVWTSAACDGTHNTCGIANYPDQTSCTGNTSCAWDDNAWTAGYHPAVNITLVNVSQSVLFRSFWYDDVSLYQSRFAWNASTLGASCGTWENDSWAGFSGLSGVWANTTKTIPTMCEGKNVSAFVYANDSSALLNVTYVINLVVANVSPTVNTTARNVTETATGNTICTNATASDVGIGVDEVWQTVFFPNSSMVNVTLDNASSKGTCGGGAAVWSAYVNVGNIPSTQGFCTGNVDACASFTDQPACDSQYCCTWDGLSLPPCQPGGWGGSCFLFVRACSAFTSSPSCGGNLSCLWSTSLIINRTWANDSFNNIGVNNTQMNVSVFEAPWFPAVGANDTRPIPLEAVMFNATIADDVSPSGYIFNWNGSSCGTGGMSGPVTNDSWVNFGSCSGSPDPCSTWDGTDEATCNSMSGCLWDGGAACMNNPGHDNCNIVNYPDQASCNGNTSCTWSFNNNTNATTVKTILNACENQTIQWRYYANDTDNHWNETAQQQLTVGGRAPVISQYAVNTTTAFTTTTVCVNTTIIDANIGMDPNSVYAAVGFPNSTLASIQLTNSTVKGTCGGGGDVYSAQFGVGTTASPPKLLITYFTGRDLAGNPVTNSTLTDLGYTLNVTIDTLVGSTPPWFTNTKADTYTPLPLAPVAFTSKLYDDIEVEGYIFSWNGTGANCDTWANDSWTAAMGNGTNALAIKLIPGACEGLELRWLFYANDSENLWNVTPTNLPVRVQSVSPDVGIAVANVSSAVSGSTICINSTVTDVGIGVNDSSVVAGVTFPNTTGAVIPLTNSSAKGDCGGGGDVYSAFISVGSTVSPPNLTVGYVIAEDLLGNTGSNTNQTNVTVYADNPPYFPAVGANNTYPLPDGATSVMHNATIADDFGISGYVFSWNGADCSTQVNDSWVAFSTNNTNASVTKAIPNACEGKHVQWRFYANDTNGAWGVTQIWEQNATINASLPDIGQISAPSVFQIGTQWFMITGRSNGFYGFDWTGSAWEQNTTINASLPYSMLETLPNVFTIGTQTFMLAGQDMAALNGFDWNGTGWTQNNTINASLPDLGNVATPAVFQIGSQWFMIAGEKEGGFFGFDWNGTGWTQNNTINASLPDIINGSDYSSPSVFQINSQLFLISGEVNGNFFGFDRLGPSELVQNVSPVISQYAVNTTSTPAGNSICLNATVTDVGVGVSNVTTSVVFPGPFLTPTTIYLDNSSSKGTCGGGGSVYSARIGVGSAAGTLLIMAFQANDSVGNAVTNTTAADLGYTMNVTVYTDNPPWFPLVGANNTNPQPAESVMHNATIADDNGLSGYIFSWTGTNCTTWANDSWVSFTANNTNASITKIISGACEGRQVQWRVYANDSNSAWGVSQTQSWQEDTYVNASLPDIGSYAKPSVFQIDSIWYLIAGENGGGFFGFDWNGTGWTQNATINASLPDIGTESKPSVFQIGTQWFMIAGESVGGFFGFDWNGTGWTKNSTINASLPNIGTYSVPSVFQMGTQWFMIAGADSGGFFGFDWNGTGWTKNSTINASLPDIGGYDVPSVFQVGSQWFMIAGENGGGFFGFDWNGTGWTQNATINASLPNIGTESKPNVFQKDGLWQIIASSSVGTFFGFGYTPAYSVQNNPSPVLSGLFVNQSSPQAGEAVMHNATVADDVGLSGYVFSWNASGANCDTWENDSWVSYTANNTVIGVSKVIPSNCENKTISWRYYANDSLGLWGVSQMLVWQQNATINASLPDIGIDSAPSVFQMGTQWLMIAGVFSSGKLLGFDWTGSAWEQNSTINASLPSVGTESTPSVFQIGSQWFLLAGLGTGTFNGFDWNGTGWTQNATINASLPDIGSDSAPGVFQIGTQWFMIAGESVGGFFGFDWNGTGWTQNATINASLPDVGSNSGPSVFQAGSKLYLLAGETAGGFFGFDWTGSAWEQNSTVNASLPDIGSWSKPSVFHLDKWYLTAGGAGGTFYGFDLLEPYSVQNTAPAVSTMAVNVTTSPISSSICTNATVSDVGVGVSVVWQTITYPNSTVKNITLQNASSIDGCGGGADVWSQRIGFGTTTGTLYVNVTWANDTLGNLGSNATQLNVTVFTDNPPWFPLVGANQTTPQSAESVMHNATIADDFAISGYIFSWNASGASCTAVANDTWVEFTINNTNASIIKTIPNACENRTIGWRVYANDSVGKWNVTAMQSYRVLNVSPVISTMKANTTVSYRNHSICTNATVTDVGRGVSKVWQTVTFPNATIANISLVNTASAGECGGGGSVYAAKIRVGLTLSPPDLTINTTWANDTVGNYGSNSTAWNVTIYNYNSLAPQLIRVRVNPYNQTMNATVVVASEWSDESENNLYPNAYGPGLRGNYTVTTNATNSLYTNYLQYVYSDYYGAVTFGNGTWKAETFKLNNWNAFASGASVPPIIQACLLMRLNFGNSTNGTINIEIYGAAANGSVNRSNKIATSNMPALTSNSYKWYCGDLNQSTTLTAGTNYTLLVNSIESNVSNKYGVAYIGPVSDAYTNGRLWTTANNATSWTLAAASQDMAFRLMSKPVSSPTWKTFNSSVWSLPSFMLYNSTASAFYKPGNVEDFSNNWLWTTPIGWNYTSSGAMISVRNSSSCYAENNVSLSIGLNCLYFNDTSTTATPSIQRYFGSAPKFSQINFTMVNRNSTGAIAVRFLTPAGSRLLDLVMDGYSFRYSNSSAYLTLANTTNFLNEFLNISLNLNANTSTFNLTVNGDSVTGQRTWYKRDVGGIGRIQVFTHNATSYRGEAWVANISLTDIFYGSRAWANYSLATPTDPGKYAFFFNVWDTDGNTNNTNNETLCVGVTDCADIRSEIYNPENGAFINGNVTLDAWVSSTFPILNATFQRINASNPTGSWTTICTRNSSPYSRCNWDVSGLTDISQWTVNVILFDVYGNSNNNTDKATNSTFTVDHRIPGVFNHTVDYPAGQDYGRNGQSVTLNLSATDFSGAGLSNITIDLTELCGVSEANMTLYEGSAGSNGTGNWTYTCASLVPLVEGNYTSRVTATDLADPDHNVNSWTFFTVQILDAQTSGCTYAGYGDWTIPAGTNCIFENQVLNITGDFNISGNASFINTSVLMNSSSDGEYGITVAGNLTSSNSTFDANQTGINYRFVAENGAYFEMSNSTVVYAGIGDNDGERGLTIRTGNSILNTTRLMNGIAGVSIENATPLVFGNNTATGNSLYGYYARGMQNCLFYNNNATNSGEAGLKDVSGSACNYTDSYFTNASAVFEGTDSSLIRNIQTTVISCGTSCYSLDLSGSQNTINNSVFNASGISSLLRDSGESNAYYNSRFNTPDTNVLLGILLGAQNAYFNNVTFGSNGSEAAGAELAISSGSYGIIAFNSTIPRLAVDDSTGILLVDSNVSEYISLSNAANVTARNTTLPPVATHSGTGNFLTRQWYVDALITDNTSAPLAGAVVSSNDSLGGLVLDALPTNASGQLGSWQNITNYVQTELGITNYTPHGFNASLAGYGANSTQSTITQSRVIALQLSGTGVLACGSTLPTNTTLTENLASNGTCFTVTASEITLDCAGFTITGNLTGFAVDITRFNSVTVQGCALTNFSAGVYALASNGTNVQYNAIYNNTIGISLNAGNSTIANNTLLYNNHSFYLNTTTANNTIQDNTLANSLQSDVNSTAANFALYNNTVYRTYGSVMFFNASNNSNTNDGLDSGNFNVSRGFVTLNSSNSTSFNVSARIYFDLSSLGLSGQPTIYWNESFATTLFAVQTTGEECPASICSGISWNYSNGNLTFTVARFSSYGIGYCGDGVCEPAGESQYTCPADCGSPPGGGPTPTPTPSASPNPTTLPTATPSGGPQTPEPSPGTPSPVTTIVTDISSASGDAVFCVEQAQTILQTTRRIFVFEKTLRLPEGTQTTYTTVVQLSLQNKGDRDLFGVELSESIPIELGSAQLLNYTAYPASFRPNNTVVWKFDSLNAGEIKVVNYSGDKRIFLPVATSPTATFQSSKLAAKAFDYFWLYVIILLEIALALFFYWAGKVKKRGESEKPR